MTRIDYITIPEETPDSRNKGFYEEIARNWEERAKNLQSRRWEQIEHRQKV